MNKDLQLAWAAGFWDGEGYAGCVSGNHGKSKRLHAQVVQTNRDILEKFQRAIGTGKLYGPYRWGRANYKEYWQLHFDGLESVEMLFSALGTYLSATKTEQFQAALQQFKEYQKQPKKRGGPVRKIPKDLFLTLSGHSNKKLAGMFNCDSSTISRYRKEAEQHVKA